MSVKESDNIKSHRFRFSEGERILCFHGPLIYEAKCLKVRKNDKDICEYLVHYAGWNKSWDEWITDTRMLKYNEHNLTQQRDLVKAHKDAKRLKGKGPGPNSSNTNSNSTSNGNGLSSSSKEEVNGRSSTMVSASDKTGKNNSAVQDGNSDTASSTSRKRKRGHDPTVETEEHYLARVEIKVKIPDELKPWLVDDWDLVCRQRKIISLPAKTNVDEIIENYIKQKTSSKNSVISNNRENAAIQTANGIKEYFNATLGTKLLYRSERVQYSEILEKFPDVPMSSIYGATHLLRLFVILGGLTVYTAVDERTVQVLQTYLHDFLKYLQKQMANLFNLQNYRYTTAEYHRKLLQS